MQDVIRRMMEKWGTAMRLCRNGAQWDVKAFFDSVRSKSWDVSDSDYSPLGEIPRGRHVYMGPLEPEAAAGDTLWVGEKAYLVRRSEIVRGGRGPLYCWALCLEKGGEDTWGQS